MRKPTDCPACFENGRKDHHPSECRAYLEQRAFTKRVARLLANTIPWYAQPVPQAPDHTGPRPGMTPGAREFAELLDQDGRAYRLYMKACERAAAVLAALPDSEPKPARARKAA